MSCSCVDLKAYVLGEMDRQAADACETHIADCTACREEADRLKLTQSALFSLPDEEIPQRIAFVSDQVFEPRWWQTIWRSGPAMGFASAALLAGAILVSAFTRPAPIAAPVARLDTAAIERRIDEKVAQRVQSAVATAVSAAETRLNSRNAEVLAAAEKRFEFQRHADLVAAQETINLYKNQMGRMMVAANYPRSDQ